jgi:hypothetical protein
MQDTEAEKIALEQKITRLNKLILVSSSVVPSHSMKRRQAQSSASLAQGARQNFQQPPQATARSSKRAKDMLDASAPVRRRPTPGNATDIEDSRNGHDFNYLSDTGNNIASFIPDSDDDDRDDDDDDDRTETDTTKFNSTDQDNGSESDSSGIAAALEYHQQQQQQLIRALQLKEEHQQSLMQNIQTLAQSLAMAKEANTIKETELTKSMCSGITSNHHTNAITEYCVWYAIQYVRLVVAQTLAERETVIQQLVESKLDGVNLKDFMQQYVSSASLQVCIVYMRMPYYTHTHTLSLSLSIG